jgi:hypothetical protein
MAKMTRRTIAPIMMNSIIDLTYLFRGIFPDYRLERKLRATFFPGTKDQKLPHIEFPLKPTFLEHE